MFNESKKYLISEILSKPGWKEINPPDRTHWISQLQYNLTDDVYIQVLDLGSFKNDLSYYLVKGQLPGTDMNNYYINSYTDNYTELFSKYTSTYRDMTNYDRMMRICKYLLPFITKEPSSDIIDDIKECFIEIEDILSVEPETIWGYCNEKNEIGYFPAYRFGDSLALCLFYIHHHNKIDFDRIEEEFNLIKNRLESFDIHVNSRVSIIKDDWRVIIKIKF
jgi:hypothetical protein